MIGDYELRFIIFAKWSEILVHKGSYWFSSRILNVLNSRSEIDDAGRLLLSRIFTLDKSATFDYRSFLYRCRRYAPEFDIKFFLHELSLLQGPINDETLIGVFRKAGWEIDQEQYTKGLRELCGNFELRLRVIEELRNYLAAQDPRYFLKYIFFWLEERETGEMAVKVYNFVNSAAFFLEFEKVWGFDRI